jgi:hypothetical protein
LSIQVIEAISLAIRKAGLKPTHTKPPTNPSTDNEEMFTVSVPVFRFSRDSSRETRAMRQRSSLRLLAAGRLEMTR